MSSKRFARFWRVRAEFGPKRSRNRWDMGVQADVVAFIDDMATAYARADLIVCRAGATTLAEIATLAKPAILIPYPFAADDHQRRNAEVVVQRGAAAMILDEELSGERLAVAVTALARDPERRQQMQAAVRTLATPDAVSRVVSVCRQVAEEGVR